MFEYLFMKHAFIAALAASIICGIIGTIIVEKKLIMMSGGIAHCSFGGIGLGYFLGIEPIVGGLGFSLLASMGIVYTKKKVGTKADTLIAMFWSLGMALGILFISLTPGYPPEMMSYLFGDIVAVTGKDVRFILILMGIVLILIVSMFEYWKAYLFDEEFLYVKGVNTNLFEYILFILLTIAIIALVKIVGIVLVIALLSIPTSIAKMYTDRLSIRMVLSIIFGSIFSLLGLVCSYYIDIPSGATIIIIASFVYIINMLFLGVKGNRV